MTVKYKNDYHPLTLPIVYSVTQTTHYFHSTLRTYCIRCILHNVLHEFKTSCKVSLMPKNRHNKYYIYKRIGRALQNNINNPKHHS